MEPDLAFGKALRFFRQQVKISQEKLAHECGLDRTTISLLERGLRQPTLTTILKLADVLQIQPDEIVRKTKELIDNH